MTRPFKPTNYIEIEGKKYIYLNDDNPSIAYQRLGVAFVAQPLPYVSEQFNVVPVPLMMTDEWEIIKDDPNFVSELRHISGCEQDHRFNFTGQTGYMGREVFREMQDLEGYTFEETSPIYDLDPQTKKLHLKDFLRNIARSTFTFAPRGIGSSSFRAYQAMMVGSIPIVTGMNDYPFKNEVDWDSICIRGKLEDIKTLTEKAVSMSHEEIKVMRGKAMLFWDNYCKHDNLYNKLKELI